MRVNLFTECLLTLTPVYIRASIHCGHCLNAEVFEQRRGRLKRRSSGMLSSVCLQQDNLLFRDAFRGRVG